MSYAAEMFGPKIARVGEISSGIHALSFVGEPGDERHCQLSPRLIALSWDETWWDIANLRLDLHLDEYEEELVPNSKLVELASVIRGLAGDPEVSSDLRAEALDVAGYLDRLAEQGRDAYVSL